MPDEPNAGGTFGFDSGTGGGGRWRRAARALTGSAQASLKFDIPGLKDFRKEIQGIGGDLDRLRKEFLKLNDAPKAFATQLAAINAQLKTMPANMKAAGFQGGFGQAPNAIQTPPTAGGALRGGIPKPGLDTGMQNLAAGEKFGGGNAAVAVADIVGKIVGAIGKRFDAGASVAGEMDVFGSRTALYTGRNAAKAYKQMGRDGMPFFGTAQEVQAQIYQQGTMGNVLGGQGVVGQRGAAAAANIQGLQYLMPGMTAQQAGGVVSGIQSNVAGQRMGQSLFGAAASMYGRGGTMKSLPEYFKGILQTIMRNRTGEKAGQPYTKEELEGLRIPGSNMYSWLAALQWDDQTINAFFDWAIGQAQYDQTLGRTFQPTDKSMQQIRGTSLATEIQKTQETQATRDTGFAGQQYGAMITQQRRDQQMIDALHSIDDHLKEFLGLAGQLPTGGMGKLAKVAGGAAMGAAIGSFLPGPGTAVGAIFGGAMGLLGDPGTSQLNPDLRSRVDAMQAANPAVGIVSGFRSSMQQKRLYDSGNPNVARPGKSQHTRGNAADLGPPSQYGWIRANARRFGLDHAGHLGEPWHVQRSGTISGIGDPATPGDDWVASTKAKQNIFATNAFAKYVEKFGSQAGAATAGGTGAASAPGASATEGPGGQTTGEVAVDTVVKALYKAGFRGDDLVNMAAIPSRESHYQADATNLSEQTKDQSYGLWQINVRKDANYQTAKDYLGSEDWKQLYDPYKSAELAYIMYQRSGNTLRPWGAYKGESNTFNVSEDALSTARTTAQGLGYLGDPMAGATAGYNNNGSTTNVAGTTIIFQNSFHVTAASATDTESLARNLSPKMENQVRRALGMRR